MEEATLFSAMQHMAQALKAYHDGQGAHGALFPTAYIDHAAESFWQNAETISPRMTTIERLTFCSPEQAARVADATIEGDLYSLGIIYYQLITGSPPFISTDPLVLTRLHVTALPAPPERCDLMAESVQLVLKLLEKAPANRYSSVAGLIEDLRILRKCSISGKRERNFVLGHFDETSRFSFKQHLYGRKAAIDTLARVQERAIKDEIILCMVSGYSGVGKTSLVRTLRQPALNANGDLIEGKFDQTRGDIPYSALVEAFDKLMQRLLSRDAETVQAWRVRITDALGSNLSVLVDILPVLEILVGPQPAPMEFSPAAAQARLNDALNQLVKLFANPDHPLVLFLDDLQWADEASLDLIRHLTLSGHGASILFVGAYRDNEVDENHPLQSVLSDLREKMPDHIVELHLEPLKINDIDQLINDACHGAIGDSLRLADRVMRKTQGNPFFARQFLQTLLDLDILYFQENTGIWQWDDSQVSAQAGSGSVIELTLERINRMDDNTKLILQSAAVIGNTFDVQLAYKVAQFDQISALRHLSPAIQSEMILPVEDDRSGFTMRFAHDRIQQAAYELKAVSDPLTLHKKIGQLLLMGLGDEDSAFDTTDHLNMARELLDHPEQKLSLALLNTRSGKEAMNALAYDAASQYFRIAIELLPDNHWQSDYPFMLDLGLKTAESLSISLREEAFFEQLAILRQHANPGPDQLKVSLRETLHYIQSDRFEEGLKSGMRGLKQSSYIYIPENRNELLPAFINEVEKFLRGVHGTEAARVMLALPDTANPEINQVIDLIAGIADVGIFLDLELIQLLSAQGCNLALEHGIGLMTPSNMMMMSIGIPKHMDALEELKAIGDAAGILAERDVRPHSRGWVSNLWWVFHWSHHIGETHEKAEATFEAGRKAHDPLFASYALNVSVLAHYLQGMSLRCAISGQDRVDKFCEKFGMELPPALSAGYCGAAYALSGQTNGITDIDAHGIMLDDLETRFGDIDLVMWNLASARISLFGYAGEFDKLLELSEHPSKERTPKPPGDTMVDFWVGVALARTYRTKHSVSQQNLDRLNAIIDKLQTISDSGGSANVAHRLYFLLAERELVARGSRADQYYQQAIQAASTNRYLVELGYIHEQYGNWLHETGSTDSAFRWQWEQACAHWRAAGANALLPRVVSALGSVLKPHDTTGNTELEFDELDTQAILESIQVITRITNHAELPAHLLDIMLRASSAHDGAIIRRLHDDLFITVGTLGREVDRRLPEGLIRYALNRNESFFLDTRSADSATTIANFGDEIYFSTYKPYEVLCLVITHEVQAEFAVFLEFRSELQGLTARSRRILEYLANQASISLLNADLYRTLEQRVARRTEELSAAKLKAEETTLAKSEFMAQLSHEIRNPINAIHGLTEIIEFEGPPPELQEHLDTIKYSVHHIEGVLNDILEFSTFEAGKFDIDYACFELMRVVDFVKSSIGPKALEKQLEFDVVVGPDLPKEMTSDSRRLGQILLNLLGNAVKFTGKGSVVLSLWSDTVEGVDCVLFEVKDTGIGFPNEALANLFNPYTQADHTIYRRFGGSGLGLTIAQSLVHRLNGSIEVESTAGVGSTFTVRLPLDATLAGLQDQSDAEDVSPMVDNVQ